MTRRLLTLASFTLATIGLGQESPKPLRAGIIGLDTGHVVAFSGAFNKGPKNPADAAALAGVKMVAAYPKGSPDIESSTSRVPEYIEDVKKLGVEIVDSIDELLKRVDVRLSRNQRRPPASRTAAPGPHGRQTGVHRQADRRLAGGHDPHPRRDQEVRRARLLLVLAALWQDHPGRRQGLHRRGSNPPKASAPRASSRRIPTSTGTACTVANRSSP